MKKVHCSVVQLEAMLATATPLVSSELCPQRIHFFPIGVLRNGMPTKHTCAECGRGDFPTGQIQTTFGDTVATEEEAECRGNSPTKPHIFHQKMLEVKAISTSQIPACLN